MNYEDDYSIELIRRRRRKKAAARRAIWIFTVSGIAGLIVCGLLLLFALNFVKQRLVVVGGAVQPNAPVLAPPFAITADRLAAETSGNPAAVLNYKAKTFRVTGKLREVTANIHGQCFLTFQVERGSSPRFFFPNPADASHLKPGQIVTVEGDVYTDGGTIDIGPCRIMKVEEGPNTR